MISSHLELFTALFFIAAASLGAFLLWWVVGGWLYESSKFLKLLPDSALAQPVLDSSEGKAFLARYPSAETYVFQDFNMPDDCCHVTLGYIQNKTQVCISDEYGYLCAPQGPGATLDVRLDVSADRENITIASMGLRCSAETGEHPGHWTVKGNIVQNLRLENPDCWSGGPPPRPSDMELIGMAKNTTEGQAYLARYPNNKVIFDDSNLYQETVSFTPTISEPVQFVVYFDKADWYIDRVAIRCSNGHYHDSSVESSLSPYFKLGSGCIESVHSKIEAANQTRQAKEFLTKYPNAEALSGGFVSTDSNSTIQYSHSETNEMGYADVARLSAIFRGQSDTIIDFELVCYDSADVNRNYTQSGRQLDVASLLQNSLCP